VCVGSKVQGSPFWVILWKVHRIRFFKVSFPIKMAASAASGGVEAKTLNL
jgi:hypothetical protein